MITDHSWPEEQASALNTALAECRGDVVGVFDAEDEVHPRLLRQVAVAFDHSGAEVVQGGVQLMNFQSNWYALRNCLEYFFWFRSRLHLHAERRFIPLGGTPCSSAPTCWWRWAGGTRAALPRTATRCATLSFGARVEVAYDPMLVTREETPGTLRGLLKQRTRWNQGFLQVLRKREWRRLPTAKDARRGKFEIAAAPAARCRKVLRDSLMMIPPIRYQRRAGSLRLDVGGPDDFGPLLGFLGEEFAEVGGRTPGTVQPSSASRALIFGSARPALISG